MMRMRQIIKKVFKKIGYGIVNIRVMENPQRQKPITRDDFFNLYFSKIDPQDFFFVQIGANDGKLSDPMYPYVTKYNLGGIVVEPQPDAFELLKANYKNFSRVKCVQVAIADKSGTLPFYIVKRSAKTKDNQFSMTRIASLNKASIKRGLRKKIPNKTNPEDYIQEVQINALSFADMLKRYGAGKIHLLQMDCEGYDYNILKTIDIEKLQPEIINCESCLFSDSERAEYEARLSSAGYSFFRYGDDTCAYRLN